MLRKRYTVFLLHLFEAYTKDNIASQSASLAYYTLFSLGPMLFISIALIGVILGADIANDRVLEVISGIIDDQTTEQVRILINSAQRPFQSEWFRIIGLIILMFASMGAFHEMQQGLNTIWEVKPDPNRSMLRMIAARLFSFVMVLIITFLLLLFIVLHIAFTTFSAWLSQHYGDLPVFGIVLNYLLSFAAITLLFATLFKVLPDIEMRWREVWSGALVTTLLFSLGKFLLSLYFTYTNIATVYGAAGSFIVILVWVYYSSQIFFIGAEITKIMAERRGKSRITKRKLIAAPGRTT